ncbi:hypothetical protein D3C85_753140 [compost metagenome]
MVGAVYRVHKGDDVFRAVRQANTQCPFVEPDGSRHIRGEQHDVRQTSWPDLWRMTAIG